MNDRTSRAYVGACVAIRAAVSHPVWGSSNTELVVRNCKRHGFTTTISALPARLDDLRPSTDQRDAFIATAENFN